VALTVQELPASSVFVQLVALRVKSKLAKPWVTTCVSPNVVVAVTLYLSFRNSPRRNA
jgi:hypothetical protein